MQRILDPAQIEAFTERSIPRVRLPEFANLFSRRAQRFLELSEKHAVGDYLRLMGAVGNAQQQVLGTLTASQPIAQAIALQVSLAHTHRMPLIQAAGWPRANGWRAILNDLCDSIVSLPGYPP